MKKQLFAVAIASFLIGAAPAQAQNVAIVNGVPVPVSRLTALQEQIKLQAARLGQPVPPDVQNQLKEEVIAREIFAQQAKRLGLEGTPDFRAKMELARQGLLASELFARYQKEHPITDAEAKAEYDKVVKEQTPAAGTKEYKASHILVNSEDEAKKIISEINGGAKFEDLAKKDSKDPGSGAQGGDLGWATAGTYVPEFAAALEKLKKGEMTQEPVKTQFGYHIIRLDDEREAAAPKLPAFEEVKAQIKQQLEQQQLAKYQQELRAQAKVQ